MARVLRWRILLLVLAVVAVVAGFVVAEDIAYASLWLAVGIVLGVVVEAAPCSWGGK